MNKKRNHFCKWWFFRDEIYTSLRITYGKLKFQLKRERMGKVQKGEKMSSKVFLLISSFKEICLPQPHVKSIEKVLWGLFYFVHIWEKKTF